MNILRKEKSTVNLSVIKKYYGKIDIDLLDLNDKIIERSDVKTSDFAKLFLHKGWEGILTKTHFINGKVGKIMNEEIGYVSDSAPYDAVIAPVLKFRKPLKDLFKNVQKDEKGRDIVYFSKYPIEQTYKRISGELTNQKIHYLMKKSKKYGYRYNQDFYNLCSYSVISYNNKEYIRAKRVCPPMINIDYPDYRNIDYYIELKPIKWLCDYENNRLVCLDGLIAGIPYMYTIYQNEDIKTYFFDNFLKNYLLPNLMQFVEVPKLEEVKNKEVKDNDIKIKDTILKWIKELLAKIEEIKDENDKVNIAKDLMTLAKLYTDELIKIRGKEPNKYGDERNLIVGIIPYYVYIDGEIKREINEDNKDKENLEINNTIDNLIEKASLIENEGIRLEILNEIEELKQDYLRELFKSKRPYQRIDFNKPLEKRKYSNGYEVMEYTVTLTLKQARPILIKELMAKEMTISKRINKELTSNNIRNEFSDIEKYTDEIMKR